MRALSILAPEQLVIEQLPQPLPKRGHAVVKMALCGICGSDLTAYSGRNPTMRYPIHGMGHEGVGTIVDVGPNDQGLVPGDRVALEPYIPDRTCHMCRAGRYNNCVDLHVCGVHTDGMMAEYVCHPADLLHKLPDTLDFDGAVLTEPLTIGMHGAARARVREGESVVIFGAGTIGLMAAFSCLSCGATPILVDVLASRLEFAHSELGMPHVINSKTEDVPGALRAICGGELPQAMIECTGAAAVHASMHDYVWHGGRIALVGWPHGMTTLNQTRLMQKEIDILPSRNSCGRFPQAIRLLNDGTLPIRKMLTAFVDLEQTEDTIRDMLRGPDRYLKVVVRI